MEETLTDSTHSGVVVRSYITDEDGGIVKAVVANGEPDAGTYVVTWSGHGDALALWRHNADGTLTLANSFTYDSWGRPATSTHNGISDLGFRFLYVGRADVQWDDAFNLGLAYMHARHYSPTLGRFIQPDPTRAEHNPYEYAANNPPLLTDPDGTNYLEGYYPFKLNSLEREACAKYPTQCKYWKMASEWAVWYGGQSPDKETFNALRHCIWQCLLTYWSGWGWARYWGTIHETGSPPSTSRQRIDRTIDLHNNYVGRLLGSHLGETTGFKPREAMKLCFGAWNAGYLWVYKYSRIRWSDGRVVSGVYDHWYP